MKLIRNEEIGSRKRNDTRRIVEINKMFDKM